jgi:hypothetical protein
MHLSSLIIILVFGLVIANMDLFFRGPLKKFINFKKAHDIYHGLHVITIESAFVVRTFFFVIFGITITFNSLADMTVLGISLILLAIVYVVRFVILRASLGSDIVPQLYIAPRGLITILLFYAIPVEVATPEFSQGILLYMILGTSFVMTGSLIYDKRRAAKLIDKFKSTPVSNVKWKAPGL